jgi:hypothetical protein
MLLNKLKDKILFFLDGWFFHYGIAKQLHQKYDCEIAAIVDVEDKTKQFFKNQSMVPFKNTWYLTDNVSIKNEYDSKFLEEIEKKYNIDLWKIAYSDREFRKFNKFHKFTDDEILSILEQECRFFSNILDKFKPNFLATFIPITHHNFLLHQMCKNSGVIPLTLATVKLWKRMMISKTPLEFDSITLPQNQKFDNLDNSNLEKYLYDNDPFKQMTIKKKMNFKDNKFQRYFSIMKFFLGARTKVYEKRYSNTGRTKSAVFKNKIGNFYNKKQRLSYINKNLETNVPSEVPFVYYPLHYEPERVLLIDAPYYENQISVIGNIAKSLPIGYTLFVKEHPYMETIGWRDTAFYEEIINLPNVKLFNPTVSQKEMLSKCSLVVTIAGTTCIEAAFYKKPSIVFTNQLYSILPSVTTIENVKDLPTTIQKCLNKDKDTFSVSNFINLLEENSFEFDFLKLGSEFAYKFGFIGPVIDSYLDEVEVKSFLEKHNSSFEMLADQHIKKINFHKDQIQSLSNRVE